MSSHIGTPNGMCLGSTAIERVAVKGRSIAPIVSGLSANLKKMKRGLLHITFCALLGFLFSQSAKAVIVKPSFLGS